MKCKIKELIKLLGIGYNELIIDIQVDKITFNSIEYLDDTDNIILHIFDDDQDYYCHFEDLSDKQHIMIYRQLSIIYN